MNRDTAIGVIADRLGNRTDLDSQIQNEIVLAQVELEQELDPPWFLVKKVSGLNNGPAPDYDLIPVPGDFIQEVEGAKLWWNNNGTWTPLDRALDFADTEEAELTHYTTPSFYSTLGFEMYLAPAPAEILTFRWWYYAHDTELSSNIENNWLKYAPEVLISRTGMKMAPYLKDKEALASFKNTYTLALSALRRMNEARKVSGMDLSMGFSGPDV